MTVDLPSPTPELGAWLAENRETLIRRWLELVVERSTLEELASRPLAERVRELDLLLEAARSEGAGRRGALGPEVDEAVGAAIGSGAPFLLTLLAPPQDGPAPGAWTEAVAETARREERVLHAGGLTVVVIPAGDHEAARVEADRIRAGAWQLLGGSSVLPEVGVAAYPGDATDVAGLVAAAHDRLPERVADAQWREPDEPGTPPPAPGLPAFDEDVRASRGHPDGELRDELDRWAREDQGEERRDLWRQLAAGRDERRGGEDDEPPGDDGPQADVTPLYPPRPE